ncbi:MAG: DUF4097 family beta strand repeat protein [Geodermatophilaceae bacterium]|nr:DUF4097 family beta strand repeat protein [Geodermatophilaceae bacterium]
MPTRTHTFPTSEPLLLNVRNPTGDVKIIAAEVTETTVEISPRGGSGQDATDETRVELSGDARRLDIEVPERRFSLGNSKLSITVTLPAGSTVAAHTATADVACRGSLDGLEANTASGDVSVEQLSGDAIVHSASGNLTIGSAAGSVDAKTASGNIRVATVGGHCHASSASGDITVGDCGGEFTARTASGDVRLDQAGHGSLQVNTMSGDVRVGVRRGARVWLDISTMSGRTRSDLDHDDSLEASSGGAQDEDVLSVGIRTMSGDVTLCRSAS